MGKAKPRHRKNRKHNNLQPTGIASVKETELEEFEINSNPDECLIQNIIEQTQSTNDEEKVCALQSLVHLVKKSEFLDTVIKHKIIKIAAPLLIEKNMEVRNLTAGFLRNLSASGSVEVCERLVKDDIMTPLIAVLQQYNDWSPETSNPLDTDTLLQIVNILWNLCETDETALRCFNSAHLLNILLQCLDYEKVGLDLSIAVCQCLNSVSEDNAAVVTVLQSHESALLRLLTIHSTNNRLLLLKTLVAGIILNLNPSLPWLATVLSVVDEALREDVRGIVNQLSSQLPLDNTPLAAETQTQLDNTLVLVEAQTLALEILANLASSQDDEMDVDSEESESDEEGDLNGWTEADEKSLIALSTEIQEGLAKYNLVTAVLNKMESIPENVMDIVNHNPNSKELATKAMTLQNRAFLCFNNLVSVADIEQLGGPHHLYSLIRKICSQTLQPGTDPNRDLVEASTTAMRAILFRLASIHYPELGKICLSDLEVWLTDLEVLFELALSCEPRVHANVIRIVGTLGVLMINNPIMVKVAGNFLLKSSEMQVALWLTAEAIDCLMDVFAEDCTDHIAADINLVSRLQTLTPQLKSKLRQERRTLGEHYPVVSTVMSNLTRFIKYKGCRVTATKH